MLEAIVIFNPIYTISTYIAISKDAYIFCGFMYKLKRN
jgi:hypothetical protein